MWASMFALSQKRTTTQAKDSQTTRKNKAETYTLGDLKAEIVMNPAVSYEQEGSI